MSLRLAIAEACAGNFLKISDYIEGADGQEKEDIITRAAADIGIDKDTLLASTAAAEREAKLAPRMCEYYGPLGRAVELMEPSTEASPAPVFGQLLTMISAALGPDVQFSDGVRRTSVNLFSVVAGATSAGKGTALGVAREICSRVFSELPLPQWNSLKSPNSGEVIAHSIRDQRTITVGKKQVIDDGIPDKRLLVVETELERLVKSSARTGNTIMSTLCEAYDGEPIGSNAVRDSPQCKHPHICFIAHCTTPQAIEFLGGNEGNGLANRMLWFHTPVSDKYLPEPPPVDDELEDVAKQILDGIMFARDKAATGHVWMFSADAKDTWGRNGERGKRYGQLRRGEYGLLQFAQRHRHQAQKLATIFACMDKCSMIERDHIEAAVEVIKYSGATVRLLLGDGRTGDRISDDILCFLQDNEIWQLTKIQRQLPDLKKPYWYLVEISDKFKYHPARKVRDSLDILKARNLITMRTLKTKGRPATIVELVASEPSQPHATDD